MSFIPPGENIIETKKCRISGKDFFVTNRDLEFYEKISPVFAGKKYLIPSPTLCPDERQRRRLSFRNERKFYHRKCDKTGNQMISIYSPDKPFTIYDQKIWWGDDWSPNEYGLDFDFNKNFFDPHPTSGPIDLIFAVVEGPSQRLVIGRVPKQRIIRAVDWHDVVHQLGLAPTAACAQWM